RPGGGRRRVADDRADGDSTAQVGGQPARRPVEGGLRAGRPCDTAPSPRFGGIDMKLDQTKTWAKVDERLVRTTNPRHRRMLEKLRDHMVAEADADFDLLMSTLGPNPEYRSWRDGVDVAPKGRAA